MTVGLPSDSGVTVISLGCCRSYQEWLDLELELICGSGLLKASQVRFPREYLLRQAL
jgi:hypothetical protein